MPNHNHNLPTNPEKIKFLTDLQGEYRNDGSTRGFEVSPALLAYCNQVLAAEMEFDNDLYDLDIDWCSESTNSDE